ncbi:CFEM-domain-containing protein [Metschnikowia bicuspidata var. bicuspidata NRRL YB-4993]|uniref:CFEM-domain-containing protein n=1 Tax=Metschnikowia bicuspidata var. bicuspidata NRRL YB-4993 TaxID=869754 RepID=A0A1A0HF74_9ASCO|nr:CFEM-domain-containing protein [Metschnikowia bicuspidata var. bicuspidata NRRL YB-4993]OBA22635.1 CFEM-domain-containing protein [Metschnikowia bicuspidata var. bicuspidata NRRL YB-4993]
MLYYLPVLTLLSGVFANNWKTYPAVPKTATINGFADPILSSLPSCAQECVEISVSNTPCPYWDTGCLCVMPQWSGQVAECIVASCTAATDVASATLAAYSLCSSVGANLWMMPASLLTALQNAAVVTSNSASSNTAIEAEFATVATGSSGTYFSGSDHETSSETASASSLQSSSNAGAVTNGARSLVALFSVIILSLIV